MNTPNESLIFGSSLLRAFSITNEHPQHNNVVKQSIINNTTNNKSIIVNKEEEEQHFHPISCEKCKQIHKKCDKKLPSCSNCVRRGLTCIYKEPKRKLPKSSSSERSETRFQPYPSINNQQNNVNNGAKPNEEDLLKNFLSKTEEARKNNNKCSFVKQNVELTLTFLQKRTHELCKVIIHPRIHSGVYEQIRTSSTSTIEGQALLYAIHANIEQRLGAPMDRQFDLIESTKSLLRLVSYDRNNPNVLLAQYLLSHCLLGHGKFKDALFYLNQMNFAVEEFKSKSIELKEYEKTLITVKEFAKLEILVEIEIDKDDILSTFSFADIFIKKYSQMFDFLSEYLPPINTLFPPETFTKEYLFIHLRTIERVVNIMFIFLKAYCNDLSKKVELDLYDYYFTRLFKILCIRTIDKMEFGLIINLCNEVIEGTNNEYFYMLSSKIINPIVVSAREVIRIINYIQSFDSNDNGFNYFNIDLFDLLQKHLNVIKKLGSKFKRVEIYYSKLIKEIECTLQSKIIVDVNHFADNSDGKENNLENNELVMDIPEVEALVKELVN